jgi:hypothetical protein
VFCRNGRQPPIFLLQGLKIYFTTQYSCRDGRASGNHKELLNVAIFRDIAQCSLYVNQVSEERITSIFRVESKPRKKTSVRQVARLIKKSLMIVCSICTLHLLSSSCSLNKLRHYATNRKVAGSIPDEVKFYVYLILPAALGPGVYSASNINEYQKH